MSPVPLPDGFQFHRLQRQHPRGTFRCGDTAVDDWLATKALQHQEKRLSVTQVLVDPVGSIVGFYTLATGQVDFRELPHELARHLPHRLVPVAILAWMGVSLNAQGRGHGPILLAQALRDCHEAGKQFAFVAVILDCLTERAKSFYQKWDFRELPEQPNRLYLSSGQLDVLMQK